MKKYVLAVEVRGYEYHEVEANSEDEAIELFWDGNSIVVSTDEVDIWEVYVESEKEI